MSLRFFAVVLGGWLAATAAAQAPVFDFDTLTQMAREQAAQPWQAHASTTPA